MISIENLKLKHFLSLLLITLFFNGASAIAADKLQVVYFFANWNFASRKAKFIVEETVDMYGNKAELIRLDIDSSSTLAKAAKLGLKIPKSVPYIVLLDSTNNIILYKKFENESSEKLKQIFDTAMNKK